MRTAGGRKVIARKRRKGRKINIKKRIG